MIMAEMIIAIITVSVGILRTDLNICSENYEQAVFWFKLEHLVFCVSLIR